MSSSPKMNSTKNLSLIHPDDIKESITHVSNMPIDECIEYNNNAPYISSESFESSLEFSDESNNESLIFKEINDQINEEFEPIDIEESIDIEDSINVDITGEIHEPLLIDDVNLGDGKMDYILNTNDKLMMTNAWQAITQTNNWDFVAEDIDSFMFSEDPRITQISIKMKELGYGHSGCSFGCTMRNMQYLAQKGEEKFKQLFKKIIINNFLK